MTMNANSSPKPRCDAKAAKPRPAAIPATGPIQDFEGAAAAVDGLAAVGLVVAGARS